MIDNLKLSIKKITKRIIKNYIEIETAKIFICCFHIIKKLKFKIFPRVLIYQYFSLFSSSNMCVDLCDVNRTMT